MPLGCGSFADLDSFAAKEALVSRKAPCTGLELRDRVMRVLQQAASKGRISGDATEPSLLTLEELLQTATPGADELLAKLCQDFTPATLDQGFRLKEFLKLVVAHQDGKRVAATLATLFTANAMFYKHDGPPFHIYWALEMRDAGIAAWKGWLARQR